MQTLFPLGWKCNNHSLSSWMMSFHQWLTIQTNEPMLALIGPMISTTLFLLGWKFVIVDVFLDEIVIVDVFLDEIVIVDVFLDEIVIVDLFIGEIVIVDLFLVEIVIVDLFMDENS